MSSQQPAAKPPPLPVIPVDRQVHRDHQSSKIGLVIVIMVLVLGVLAFFASVGQGAGVSVQGIIGLVVIAAAALIPSIALSRKPAPVTAAIASTTTPPVIRRDGVLDYQAPRADERELSGGAFFAQCIAGIILGIVGGAFLTGAFASIANGSLSLFGIFAPTVIGGILCSKPRLRGLGIGLILALPAAFLLLLGFCALIIGGGKLV